MTLHNKDDPVPWAGRPIAGHIIGPDAEEQLHRRFGPPHWVIIRCDTCGRWQEFKRRKMTFQNIRQQSYRAGWRWDGDKDRCPVCVTLVSPRREW